MRHTAFWLSLLCALLFAAGPSAQAATDPVGKIDALSGTCSVEREGRKLPGKTGDPVHLLDKWQTGAGSSIEILFLDNSRVKLSAATVLEITEYLYNPDQKTRQTLLSMAAGKARFLVQDLRDFKEKRFRVQTQTSVVGTRDTDYIVSVKPEAQADELCREALTEALCIENAVTLTNRDHPENQVVLTANMISRICGLNPPTPPRFVTADERMRLLRGVEKIGSKMDSASKAGKTGSAAESPGGAAAESQALAPEVPTSGAVIPTATVPAVTATSPPPTLSGSSSDPVAPTLHLPPSNTKTTTPTTPGGGVKPPPLPPPPPPPQ